MDKKIINLEWNKLFELQVMLYYLIFKTSCDLIC